jgi:hypothetical protein
LSRINGRRGAFFSTSNHDAAFLTAARILPRQRRKPSQRSALDIPWFVGAQIAVSLRWRLRRRKPFAEFGLGVRQSQTGLDQAGLRRNIPRTKFVRRNALFHFTKFVQWA